MKEQENIKGKEQTIECEFSWIGLGKYQKI